MNQLQRLAQNAATRAYSPYSGIRVGAAVEDESGKIFTGCNIENASYGLTLCAERVAIAAAVAAGATRIARIAVTLDPTGEPVERFTPCGACLQFIAEFADELTDILVQTNPPLKLKDLMPSAFVVS